MSIRNVFWLIALLGSVLSAYMLFQAFTADSAPKQGAAAAMALGVAVIPYCLARSVENIDRRG
jgi:hypothetical protein